MGEEKMNLERSKIKEGMNKEEAILYYLFIDEQMMCSWWDYLEFWNYRDAHLEPEDNPEFHVKMKEIMDVVEYWEDILNQLKGIITHEDIENYVREHPEITKGYLFVK
jgi:hypothetical protein